MEKISLTVKEMKIRELVKEYRGARISRDINGKYQCYAGFKKDWVSEEKFANDLVELLKEGFTIRMSNFDGTNEPVFELEEGELID